MLELQFLDMCILAGCDYCPALPGNGIKNAWRLVRDRGSLQGALRHLRATGAIAGGDTYAEDAERAKLTFVFHWVWDPSTGRCVTLRPRKAAAEWGVTVPDLDGTARAFLGDRRDTFTATAVAHGHLHPDTLDPYPGEALAVPKPVASPMQRENLSIDADASSFALQRPRPSGGAAAPRVSGLQTQLSFSNKPHHIRLDASSPAASSTRRQPAGGIRSASERLQAAQISLALADAGLESRRRPPGAAASGRAGPSTAPANDTNATAAVDVARTSSFFDAAEAVPAAAPLTSLTSLERGRGKRALGALRGVTARQQAGTEMAMLGWGGEGAAQVDRFASAPADTMLASGGGRHTAGRDKADAHASIGALQAFARVGSPSGAASSQDQLVSAVPGAPVVAHSRPVRRAAFTADPTPSAVAPTRVVLAGIGISLAAFAYGSADVAVGPFRGLGRGKSASEEQRGEFAGEPAQQTPRGVRGTITSSSLKSPGVAEGSDDLVAAFTYGDPSPARRIRHAAQESILVAGQPSQSSPDPPSDSSGLALERFLYGPRPADRAASAAALRGGPPSPPPSGPTRGHEPRSRAPALAPRRSLSPEAADLPPRRPGALSLGRQVRTGLAGATHAAPPAPSPRSSAALALYDSLAGPPSPADPATASHSRPRGSASPPADSLPDAAIPRSRLSATARSRKPFALPRLSPPASPPQTTPVSSPGRACMERPRPLTAGAPPRRLESPPRLSASARLARFTATAPVQSRLLLPRGSASQLRRAAAATTEPVLIPSHPLAPRCHLAAEAPHDGEDSPAAASVESGRAAKRASRPSGTSQSSPARSRPRRGRMVLQ